MLDGLGPARYDACISCFGVMFFADPVAAFTNIGRALRGRAPDIEDLGPNGQERGNLGPAGRRVTPARSPPAPPL